MKKSPSSIKLFFSVLCMFAFTISANGQILKKLGKKAEKAAERAIERRVEKEAQEKTDEVLDSILEPGKKGKQEKSPIPPEENPTDTKKTEPSSNPDGDSRESETSNTTSSGSEPKTMKVYSKFDFVPGDKLLFFDDFKNDFVGDFPSKWNTNSSGELVKINDSSNKWLKLLPGYKSRYIPDVTSLPEEFTLEFDVITSGLNKNTSSQSYLSIIISDNNSFNKPNNYGLVEYSFCQFIARGIVVENNINGKREIRNEVNADIRNIVLDQHHISIAVNKQRFRMWINEQKLIDVPRLLSASAETTGIKFGLRGTDTNTEGIYLGNFKVAEGGVDLRRKLLSEGKVSTNGILFDSGSANIQPQSMGIIRQIYQVLQQDASINLKIVGHTDAAGGDDTNMSLSKKRAEAVMNALISIYNTSPERLTAEGMGESQPVADNNSEEGKAQNRRVEFVKQ